MSTRPFNASGFQVAFLIFVVVFLGAPAQKYLGPLVAAETEFPNTLGRLFFFIPALLILFLVPPLRRFCRQELRVAIPKDARFEVGMVAVAHVLLPFAIFGGVVLWYWLAGGEMALARRIGMQETLSVSLARALSADGLILLLLSTTLGPLVEELVFRGILFRTWEAEWGWFKSIIATSLVFASYHPVPVAAFVASLIFVALYRRTGSLRSCILVHALFNGLLWPPLVGQYVFAVAGKETGELHLWPFHIAALIGACIAIPIYIWMARGVAATDLDESGNCVAARS